ncbi:hypothetical protein Hgul01_03861 [Herpetosiphon gulosus]|uniref:Uncharacterized protein n=2 Tax=Herpetosiphon gulosus TaxID=1973496 RepID=A0ABP9X3Q6_9CHLR
MVGKHIHRGTSVLLCQGIFSLSLTSGVYLYFIYRLLEKLNMNSRVIKIDLPDPQQPIPDAQKSSLDKLKPACYASRQNF